MITKEFFHYLNRSINAVFWALFLQGITLIALALLIFFFPTALIVLAVVFFVWIGLVFVLLALKIWLAKRKYQKYWDWLD